MVPPTIVAITHVIGLEDKHNRVLDNNTAPCLLIRVPLLSIIGRFHTIVDTNDGDETSNTGRLFILVVPALPTENATLFDINIHLKQQRIKTRRLRRRIVLDS
mmetsp:Transcript_20529/g.29307  ORF Transcript_20529/g.29307 Transcript_20529/m.29307 type:complete len:103 (-) Transcript_20529:81-389(-)